MRGSRRTLSERPIGAPRLTGGRPILGHVADTRARQNELDHVDELGLGETACRCAHGGPERLRALLRSSQDDARDQMLREVMEHSPRCAETEGSDATRSQQVFLKVSARGSATPPQSLRRSIA
jgi:hypothetical protein